MEKCVVKIEKTRTANVLYPQISWKYTCYTFNVNRQVIATYFVKLSFTLNRATLTKQNIYYASHLVCTEKTFVYPKRYFSLSHPRHAKKHLRKYRLRNQELHKRIIIEIQNSRIIPIIPEKKS